VFILFNPYCNKAEVKEYDMKREDDFKRDGYNVVRFTNQRITAEIEAVIAEIKTTVENLNKSSK